MWYVPPAFNFIENQTFLQVFLMLWNETNGPRPQSTQHIKKHALKPLNKSRTDSKLVILLYTDCVYNKCLLCTDVCYIQIVIYRFCYIHIYIHKTMILLYAGIILRWHTNILLKTFCFETKKKSVPIRILMGIFFFDDYSY